MARTMSEFRDAIHYRMAVRWPRLISTLTLQLPLRDISHIYTSSDAAWEYQIPNVVHQTWVEPLLGRSHVQSIEVFREQNPEFTFRFYSEEQMNFYMRSRFSGEPVLRVFESALFGPMRTDIFRYCLLYRDGGVYCDIGKGIGRPLRSFLKQGTTGVLTRERSLPPSYVRDPLEPRARLANWALMFAPGHPVLGRVIDGIVDKAKQYADVPFPNPKEAILRLTGPVHLTESVQAAESAGETHGVLVAGTDWDGAGILSMPGAYVRYVTRHAYVRAANARILTAYE